MTILVLSGQWFPDYAGGTARVVRATAEGLAKQGREVVTLVPQAPREPGLTVMNGVGVRRCAPWILLCFVLATGVAYRFSSYVVG
jgi:hypothetical protein